MRVTSGAQFVREQPTLHREAERVTTEAPITCHHAVARHDDRNRVCPVCAAHGSHGTRRVHRLRLLGIRNGAAVWNLAHRRPRPRLKRRAFEMQRHREFRALAGKIFAQLSHAAFSMTLRRKRTPAGGGTRRALDARHSLFVGRHSQHTNRRAQRTLCVRNALVWLLAFRMSFRHFLRQPLRHLVHHFIVQRLLGVSVAAITARTSGSLGWP